MAATQLETQITHHLQQWGPGASSRREVPLRAATLSSSGTTDDTLAALQADLLLRPRPFMDNETAVVLRRLREGYAGSLSSSERNEDRAS